MAEMQFCPLTGLISSEKMESKLKQVYSVLFDDNGAIQFHLCKRCKRSEFLEDQNHFNLREIHKIIRYQIAHGKFDPELYGLIHWSESCPHYDSEHTSVKRVIENVDFPKSARNRRERVLTSLFHWQHYDCSEIELDWTDDSEAWEFFLENRNEYQSILSEFEKKGLIERIDLLKSGGDTFFKSLRFTHDGLDHVEELLSQGPQSKIGFVAMSFSDDLREVRAAVKKAIEGAGYEPLIVDEVHNPSDKTIPDRIFSSIRQAKFCVADFSQHKHGVYFEAGFALGLGRPVIYTCSQQDFEKAHFDIKQLQHIIYSSPQELEERLRDKIVAWIS
jgi:nucleoside 2-deoxyribosyltransferase